MTEKTTDNGLSPEEAQAWDDCYETVYVEMPRDLARELKAWSDRERLWDDAKQRERGRQLMTRLERCGYLLVHEKAEACEALRLADRKGWADAEEAIAGVLHWMADVHEKAVACKALRQADQEGWADAEEAIEGVLYWMRRGPL